MSLKKTPPTLPSCPQREDMRLAPLRLLSIMQMNRHPPCGPAFKAAAKRNDDLTSKPHTFAAGYQPTFKTARLPARCRLSILPERRSIIGLDNQLAVCNQRDLNLANRIQPERHMDKRCKNKLDIAFMSQLYLFRHIQIYTR